MIMGADKSQDLQGESASKRPRRHKSPEGSKPLEEPLFEFESEGRKKSMFHFKDRKDSLLLVGGSDFFVVLSLSTDWMRPTHIGEGGCALLVYHLNVNLIQKHPHRNTQNNA